MHSIKELQELINNEIINRSEDLKKRIPKKLYVPVNYSLEMGGKRLRPLMLLLSYNLFHDHIQNAMPAALAIEVFHNFTLLHDDIMDNADVRRNRETVHKIYGENAAILSGDVMAFLSYNFLFECKADKLQETVQLFTQTAIEVCEGQQFDMDFEGRLDVTENEYLEMIRLKTAVLLACGLKAGALLANASNEMAEQLYNFGINLGMAFQLQDDMLDTFGEQETFGKRIGGDILSNKKTFLLIKALEKTTGKEKIELLEWIRRKDFDENEKIQSVTRIYNQLNITELVRNKVEFYFQEAMRLYADIPLDESRKSSLLSVSNNMLNRIK